MRGFLFGQVSYVSIQLTKVSVNFAALCEKLCVFFAVNFYRKENAKFFAKGRKENVLISHYERLINNK